MLPDTNQSTKKSYIKMQNYIVSIIPMVPTVSIIISGERITRFKSISKRARLSNSCSRTIETFDEQTIS